VSSITDFCTIHPTWHMSREEWAEARNPTLGGSEISTAAGLNPYDSRLSLWAKKLGRIPGFEGNEATVIGNKLEATVAEMYAETQNVALVTWPVLLRSKLHPFMSANVDGWLVEPSAFFPAGQVTEWRADDPPAGIQCIWEAKTGAIASPGKPYEWFENGESTPLSYALQGFWYLATTGLDRVEYGALIGGHGLITRTLHRDEEVINDLIEIGREFWYLVENEIEPEVDGSTSTEETLKALYPRHSPGVVYRGDETLAGLWEAYKASKDAYSEAEANRKKARAALAALLGNAEEAYLGDTPICTFRASKDVERLDLEALKREQPGIVKQYTRLAPGSRQIREVR
jgi:putative phage-type endonuclease